MLIRKPQPYTLQDFLSSIYTTFDFLISQTYSDYLLPYSLLIIQSIIITIFDLSIYFQSSSHNQLLDSASLSWLFDKMALLNPNTHTTTPNLVNISTAIACAFALLNLAFTLMLFFRLIKKKPFLVFTVYFLRLTRLLAIPLFYILFGSLLQTELPSFKFLWGCLILLLSATFCLYSKFYFSPVRFFGNIPNLYFTLDSSQATYFTAVLPCRIALILVYGVTPPVLAALPFLQLIGFASFPSSLNNPYFQTIRRIPTQINILTASTLLCNLWIQNTQSILYLWFAGILGLISTKLLNLFKNSPVNVDVLDCDSRSEPRLVCFLSQTSQLLHNDPRYYFRDMFSFASNHSNECRSGNCFLKSTLPELIECTRLENPQSKVRIDQIFFKEYMQKLLESHASLGQRSAVLYYLHLFQQKNFAKMKTYNKNMGSIGTEFIIHHLRKCMVREQQQQLDNSSRSNSEEKISIKDNFQQTRCGFFRQFRVVTDSLLRFLYQLQAKQPKSSVIEDLGFDCSVQLSELKGHYTKVFRSDRFDLKVVEFYLQFFSNLIVDTKATHEGQQLIEKKARRKPQLRKLSDSSLAALQVNLTNLKILDLNLEAIKLLNYHKIELIDKPLSLFIEPSIPSSQNFDKILSRGQSQTLFGFGKTRIGELVPMKLKCLRHQNPNKFFIEISPAKVSSYCAYVLVSRHLEIISKSCLSISPRGSEPIPVVGIVSNLAEPMSAQLLKMGRVQFDYLQDLNINVDLFKTWASNIFCIQIKSSHTGSTSYPVKNSERTISVVLSPRASKGQQYIPSFKKKVSNARTGPRLCFSLQKKYRQKVQFQGTYLPIESCAELFRTRGDGLTFKKESFQNYAKGILSYRLDGDIIYNIEFQEPGDKMICSDPQDHYQYSDSSEKGNHKRRRIAQTIRIALTISILVLFLTLLAEEWQFHNSILRAKQGYKKYIDIELLELRFYRISCLMRDGNFNFSPASGINVTWHQQVLSVYSQILLSQSKKLFSDTIRSINFLGISYQGTLDQIFNFLLSFIYKAAHVEDLSITEDIHYQLTHFVGGWVIEERALLLDLISTSLADINRRNYIYFGIQAMLIFMSSGLMIIFNRCEMQKRKDVLLSYRLMSERLLASLVTRLKYLQILMTLNQKQEEVQVTNSLLDSVEPKQNIRQFAKDFASEVAFCEKSFLILAAFSLISFGIVSQAAVSTYASVQNLKDCFRTNKDISSTYIDYLFISIDTENGISAVRLQSLKDSLANLERKRGQFPFSSETSNFVEILYYDDSCNIAKTVVAGLNCENFAKGYLVENPFEEGLTFYFQHVHYSLQDNITETLPSTGLSARPFHLLFTLLVNRTLSEWESKVSSIMDMRYSELALQLVVVGVIFLLKYSTVSHNQTLFKRAQKVAEMFPDPFGKRKLEEVQEDEDNSSVDSKGRRSNAENSMDCESTGCKNRKSEANQFVSQVQAP